MPTATHIGNGKDIKSFLNVIEEGKNPEQKLLKKHPSFEKKIIKSIKESLQGYGKVVLEETTYSEAGFTYKKTKFTMGEKPEKGKERSLVEKVGGQTTIKETKTSFTKYELIKDSIKALAITGVGTGALATFFFDYKIGLVLGTLSATLNIHGVFYRNKHYSKYYNLED